MKIKLSQILKDTPNKPRIISSDNGQEFQGLVLAFLDEAALRRGINPPGT